MIETDGVVVGVNRACSIPGRAQVTGALRLARTEAEMMSQQYEVFEPLWVVSIQPLQGGTDPSMHLDAPLQKEILIDHILKHGLRETVGLQRNRIRTRDLLDNLRVAQKFKSCCYLRRFGRCGTEQSGIEARYVLPLGVPRVRRWAWAQIHRMVIDDRDVMLELWTGEYDKLPAVARRADLAAILEHKCAQHGVMVTRLKALD